MIRFLLKRFILVVECRSNINEIILFRKVRVVME